VEQLPKYLLVRDSDGAVMAELDSAESALRMLELLGEDEFPLQGVSVVRLDDSPGELLGTTSAIAMRPAGFGSGKR
jgi:hypothetical protein